MSDTYARRERLEGRAESLRQAADLASRLPGSAITAAALIRLARDVDDLLKYEGVDYEGVDIHKQAEGIQQLIRELDNRVQKLRLPLAELGSGPCQTLESDLVRKMSAMDAVDHLRQVHLKLTDCRGQIEAVSAALRTIKETK